MKKIVAVILGLMLILLCGTGCAQNNVVHYVDENTLDIEFYPMSADGQTFASGLTALQIVVNTPNLEIGSGELAIYNASTGERVARYDARMDTDYFYLNTKTNPAYAQFIVMLPEGQSFEMGETYYVTMDDGFLYVDDIKGYIDGFEEGEWEFTIANYGYDGNIAELPMVYLVGDTIEIPVAIADEAEIAVLLYDNIGAVSAEQRARVNSGVFTVDCIGEGTSTISIMFLKEDGTHLETLAFSVTVK